MNKVYIVLLSSILTIHFTGCSRQDVLSQKINQQDKITTLQNSINLNEDYIVDTSDFIQGDTLIQNIQPNELTPLEIQGLVFMREEEKLARDVYITLYNKWGLKIFKNISESEETHMNAIKKLLDRYDITDPVVRDEIGVFRSSELGGLYGNLIRKGTTSLLDALIVGATIEDLDIYDLDKRIMEIDNNQDIMSVYNNLKKGSRNHMRAFVQQIQKNGGVYTPQYISVTEYQSIISSPQERGTAE